VLYSISAGAKIIQEHSKVIAQEENTDNTKCMNVPGYQNM
jgi:hypothetical protein